MNSSDSSITSLVIVALNKQICISLASCLMISLSYYRNPLCKSKSASSITHIRKNSGFIFLLSSKFKTLPGVPTITCMPFFSAILSSRNNVFPVHNLTFNLRNYPRTFKTSYIYKANSAVGARIRP